MRLVEVVAAVSAEGLRRAVLQAVQQAKATADGDPVERLVGIEEGHVQLLENVLEVLEMLTSAAKDAARHRENIRPGRPASPLDKKDLPKGLPGRALRVPIPEAELELKLLVAMKAKPKFKVVDVCREIVEQRRGSGGRRVTRQDSEADVRSLQRRASSILRRLRKLA